MLVFFFFPAALAEVVVCLIPAALFIYGGYFWEAILLGGIAAWVLVRFVLGWSEAKAEHV
jgi:hypothetical protein